MLADLRHALRLLLQAKGWTTVVVLSLALGIGANVALFSAVNGLLLRSVPVRDPDSLVRLRWTGQNDMLTSSSEYGTVAEPETRATFSYPMFKTFVAENRTMSDLFACAPFGRTNVVVDGQADIANSFISTGNYYRVLGVSAFVGRLIEPDDDRPGAAPVAVVSHRYWRSRFGSDAKIVGKTISINSQPVTVIGVLPPEFTGVQQPIAEPQDIGLPMALDAQLSPPVVQDAKPRLSDPTYWWLQVMGRLKPGTTVQQIESNLGTVFQHAARDGMDEYLAGLSDQARSSSTNMDRTRVPRLRAEPGAHGIYDAGENEKRSAAILGAIVLVVLLIVCANVANLLLSRGATRQKEISVRLSMGATRARVARQMLTESLLLAFIGGALGLVVAYWAQQLLPGPVGQPTPPDWRVLSFVLAITTLTGVLFGMAPAWRGSRLDVSSAMKEQSRSVVGSRRMLSKLLLVAQVSLSLVLLVGAALFLRTLGNLRRVDVGFNPTNLVLFTVNPLLYHYEPPRIMSLYAEMLDRLRTVPGVRAVAFSQPALLSGSVNSTSIFIQGKTYVRGQRSSDNINRVVVSPSFFDTMELPLKAGRPFTDRDTENAPKVAVINETAARKYFPNANPIGMRFGQSFEETGRYEIVGVLRDAKYNSLRDAVPPTMYVPYTQTRTFGVAFEVRAAGDPGAATAAIRTAVRQIDPDLPLTNVTTQAEQIDRRMQQEKMFAQALALFGAIALVLAAVGLFGLMSYSVARRTNEIGIRMALGAQRHNVLALVMRESMWLVLVGIGAGVAGALAAGRLVRALLFGLAPDDASSIAAAVIVMLAVSALAAYLPARRASRVDPLVALRAE